MIRLTVDPATLLWVQLFAAALAGWAGGWAIVQWTVIGIQAVRRRVRAPSS